MLCDEIKLRDSMMELAHVENLACGFLDPRKASLPKPAKPRKPRAPYKRRQIPNAPAGAPVAAIEALDLAEWTTTKDIAHRAGFSISSTRKALYKMQAENRMVTEKRHIGTARARFWKVAIRADITRALAQKTTAKQVDDYLWLMRNTPRVNLTADETQVILERMRELE